MDPLPLLPSSYVLYNHTRGDNTDGRDRDDETNCGPWEIYLNKV